MVERKKKWKMERDKKGTIDTTQSLRLSEEADDHGADIVAAAEVVGVLTNPHSGGERIPLLHRNGRRLLVRQHVPHLAAAAATAIVQG